MCGIKAHTFDLLQGFHLAFGLVKSCSRSNVWDIVYFISWVSVLAIISYSNVRDLSPSKQLVSGLYTQVLADNGLYN